MTTQNWKSWSSSVTGPLHLKNGQPNQDSYLVKKFQWGEVVAVADGLGSKPNSNIGSKAACQAVVESAKIFRNSPNANVKNLPRLIHSIWLMKIGQYEPKNCSTTCIFGIRIDENFILGQVGDGMLVVLGQSSKTDFILHSGENNSFSNLTNALGQEFHNEYWVIKNIHVKHITALVLCTDGIADDLLYDKRIDFAREIWLNYADVPILSRKNEIQKMLTNWTVPFHTDDKTIVCLYQQHFG
ncbi:MAG: protein phosphatase 2C domain-containing protein [Planctomycetaceae bacterium]|jgi:serine/threonine protein phosphatase PrpC|nr:protein phosphatase 2C domain-containing protein [Planctomycetaceae bacterium]